nr:hypothetical protein [Polyangiaceae bacterium]
MKRALSDAKEGALAALRALADDVRRREFLRPFVVATIAFQASVVVWAMLRSDGAPRVDPRSQLEPGPAERPAVPAEGEGLRVVFAAPQGAVTDAGEVQLVWNRPLRALEAAPELASPGVLIEPAVPGAWSWVGTRALRFAPKGAWPPATEFRVTVPGGLRSLDDQVAAEPFSIAFSTPKPKVISMRPGPRFERAGKREQVLLRFNQPVSLDEVRKALSLRAGGAVLRHAVRRVSPDDAALVELVPAVDYPLDTEIVVSLDGSLRGMGGPLPMGDPYEATFRTYGPLVVESVKCQGAPDEPCRPGSALEVKLSNRVKMADFKRAIKVTPKAELLWPSWVRNDELVDSIEVPLAATPGGTYVIQIEGALRDEHKQPLEGPFEGSFVYGDATPALRLGVEGSLLPPKSPDALPFRALNVASAEIALAPLDPASIMGLAKRRRAHSKPEGEVFDFVASL